MAYKINPSKRVIKYLKEIKKRALKAKFSDAIFNTIANDPYVGSRKNGDLRTFYSYGFKYDRVAYTINDDNEIGIIILAGPQENLYEQLKRIVS